MRTGAPFTNILLFYVDVITYPLPNPIVGLTNLC